MIIAGEVDAMLVGDTLPELQHVKKGHDCRHIDFSITTELLPLILLLLSLIHI